MDNEDFVSYETAQALKMAGFNYPCYFYYTRKGAPDEHVWHTTSEEAPVDYNRSVYAGCSMPTLAQAQKWLRKHGYHIDVQLLDKSVWSFVIEDETGLGVYDQIQTWSTYESALSAGILAALKLIEEGEG